MRKEEKLLTEQEHEVEFELKIFDITDLLDHMSSSDLLKINYHLGKGEWLDILPGKPEGWEHLDEMEKAKYMDAITSYIRHHLGLKAVLRYWHELEYGSTGTEFEDWWDSYSVRLLEEKDEELYERYCRRDNSRDSQKPSFPFLSGLLLGFLIAAVAFCLIVRNYLG